MLDECPYCMLPFEIVVVQFRFFKLPRALFVCRACGLAQVEGDQAAKPGLNKSPQHEPGMAGLAGSSTALITFAYDLGGYVPIF
jgi:hypothetical protein